MDQRKLNTRFMRLQVWWHLWMDRVEHRYGMPRLAGAGRWLWTTTIRIATYPLRIRLQQEIKD